MAVNQKLKDILDPETLARLHAAGFRVVEASAPTPEMVRVLTGMRPDIYAQGSEEYYHHLWNRMMAASETDR